ncbi:unnamed protein product [Rhizophagus irregularis]|nr:unnamed protein product [Rhizophagus irregularis]
MLGCFVVGEDNTFTIKTDSIENISQLKEATRRTCLKLLMQTNLYYGNILAQATLQTHPHNRSNTARHHWEEDGIWMMVMKTETEKKAN